MRLVISPGHSLYLLQLSGLLSQWLGGPSVISQAGEQLTIGVFMDIYIPTIKRQNTKVISEMISSYNSRWDFNLTDAYDHRLLSHISHIKTYSPTEVLEQVCGALVERKVNTLMFLSGKKQMMELGASAQYIIRAANILGIPVISWIRDNSAIAQVIYYLIYQLLHNSPSFYIPTSGYTNVSDVGPEYHLWRPIFATQTSCLKVIRGILWDSIGNCCV